jgi:hypothetical protein
VHKLSKAVITAQIAALQAELAESDGGVYEDPKTGRWFIVMRPPGRAKTTIRRRAPDGSQLTTREKALIAKGQWEDVRAHGSKRLLPYFTGMHVSKIVVAVVRDWRATMLESVEAGEWARKRSTTPASRCSGAVGWPSRTA